MSTNGGKEWEERSNGIKTSVDNKRETESKWAIL